MEVCQSFNGAGPHPKSRGWERTNTMKVKQKRSAGQLPLAETEWRKEDSPSLEVAV